MRYDYKVIWTEGKKLVVADTWSRSPLEVKTETEELTSEVEAYVKLIIKSLPVKEIIPELFPYYQHRNDFNVAENILLKVRES